MHRNGRNRRGIDKNEDGSFKSLLILTGSVLAIAVITFIVTYAIYNNKISKNNQELLDSSQLATLSNNANSESASSEIGKTINQVKNEMANNSVKNGVNSTNIVNNAIEKNNTVKNITNQNKNQTSTTTNIINKNTTNTNTTANNSKEEKDPNFIVPLEGEMIRDFAKDNLVYSQTLDEWITHLGIDIKAEKATVVKVAADGKVETIKNDPRYGLTVVISHSNGFKTIYSNLLTAEFVTEGEEVKSGQTLGTVGNNASFEISDGPHLHFELIKNNEQIDPKIYIKF